MNTPHARSPFTHHSPRTLPHVWLALAIVGLALAAIGCGGGLAVTKVSSVQGKPNNLAVFLAVERDGHPVTGLTTDDFVVYEDGVAIAKADARLTLQPVEVEAATHTLILVDRSSVGAASVSSEALVTAVEGLAERAAKLGPVAVYAFDGEDAIHPVVPFGTEPGSAAELAEFKPKDGSSNLHGAVVRGAEALEAELAQAHAALRFGSLVVVAGGPDRAARRTHDEVVTELRGEKHGALSVYAVGVGAEIERANLDDFGRAGTFVASPELSFGSAMAKTATALEERWRRYYLVSYCTPARGGEHRVRVEVRAPKADASGSVDYAFVADGMGAGCDPEVPPMFAGLDAPGESMVRVAGSPSPAPSVGAKPSGAAVASLAAKTTAAAAPGLLGKLGLPAKVEIPGVATIGGDAADDADASDDAASGGGGSGGDKHKSKDKKAKDKGPKDKKPAPAKKAAPAKKPAPKPAKKKK